MQTYTELDLQPTTVLKMCNDFWFSCNSVLKFSLDFSLSLRCFMNMGPGLYYKARAVLVRT